MNALNAAKRWIGALTEVGLMLIAFAIVVGLLSPGNVPFIGTDVVSNITALVADLGDGGIVGLVALAIICWLLNKRSIS
ncbi:MAG: hypothetical protein MK002_00415 [Alphaproteobacteria bacterium]|jgi:hypothetical protein|nr:hypothetical protein [Alphaproteobacteria bacterium]|tara:strand:- start:2 stop:238 length:237 start_codon:yes stop_codon:yes gene_type:complete